MAGHFEPTTLGMLVDHTHAEKLQSRALGSFIGLPSAGCIGFQAVANLASSLPPMLAYKTPVRVTIATIRKPRSAVATADG